VANQTPDEEIKVTDRRLFRRDGEAAAPEPGDPPAAGPVDPSPSSPTDADRPEFGTFVMGLAKIALLHLGEAETQGEGTAEVNLPAARELIDILGMLHEKTAGNLSPEELHLLDTLLYELRMDFAQKASAR
jgi:hypothetical protein